MGNIENYQELAAGIVEQAVKDLTNAYTTLNRMKRTPPKAEKSKTVLNAEKMVYDCESFFRNSWFSTLCSLDCEKIIQACKEKAKGEK